MPGRARLYILKQPRTNPVRVRSERTSPRRRLDLFEKSSLCLLLAQLVAPQNHGHLFTRRWCGWVDGTPHGDDLPLRSLSAHLTAAAAALPKARPQARASCGPPAGFTGIPKPIRATPPSFTSTPKASTQPCSSVPQDAVALHPPLLYGEITPLFFIVCRVVSLIGAVWGRAGLFCVACPQAGKF